MRHLLVLLFGLLSVCGYATTFIPLTLDKQVESASMGAEVILQSTKTYKSNNGYIATEYSFKVVESFNLHSEEVSAGEVKFSLPGGSLNGVTAVVDGSPNFKVGEKIFLLLKRVDNKVYLSNFTLGMFNIETYNGEEYYINEVFPKLPNVGRIKKSSMLSLMKSKWKFVNDEIKLDQTESKIVSSENKKEAKLQIVEKGERSPATEAEKEETDYTKFFIYALALIGIVFSGLLLMSRKNEK